MLQALSIVLALLSVLAPILQRFYDAVIVQLIKICKGGFDKKAAFFAMVALLVVIPLMVMKLLGLQTAGADKLAQHATDDANKLAMKAANETLGGVISNRTKEVVANLFWDADKRRTEKREAAAIMIQRRFRKRRKRREEAERRMAKQKRRGRSFLPKLFSAVSGQRMTTRSVSASSRADSTPQTRGSTGGGITVETDGELREVVVAASEEEEKDQDLTLPRKGQPSQLERALAVSSGALENPSVEDGSTGRRMVLYTSDYSVRKAKVSEEEHADAMEVEAARRRVESGRSTRSDMRKIEQNLAGRPSRLTRARQANASHGRSVKRFVQATQMPQQSSSIKESERQWSKEGEQEDTSTLQIDQISPDIGMEAAEVAGRVLAAVVSAAVEPMEVEESLVEVAKVKVRLLAVKASDSQVELRAGMNVVATTEAKATATAPAPEGGEPKGGEPEGDELTIGAMSNVDDGWLRWKQERRRAPGMFLPPAGRPSRSGAAEAARWLRESVAAAAALDLEAHDDGRCEDSNENAAPTSPTPVSRDPISRTPGAASSTLPPMGPPSQLPPTTPEMPPTPEGLPTFPEGLTPRRAKETRLITMAEIERRSSERRKLERARLKGGKPPASSPTWREAYSAALLKQQAKVDEEEINRKFWGD